MKKVLSILLVLLLVLACIGCNDSTPNTPKKTDKLLVQDVEDNKSANDVEYKPAETDEDTYCNSEDLSVAQQNENTVSPSQKEEDPVSSCTISITCNSVFDNLDKLDPVKLEILPKDGVILSPKKIKFEEGETVFDVLLRITQENKIHMEYSSNPLLKSNYIEGINNLYEFDCGDLSGWTYKVNGEGMGFGSSSYTLVDGDEVEWVYTCDQGRDVGVEP